MSPIGRANCSVEGCENPLDAKGFCAKHYGRFVRHGDPLAGRTEAGATGRWLDEHAGFAGHDCLIWPFGRSSTGYGVTTINGRPASAHREMCRRAHGPAPTRRHQAAHSCGNGHAGCVNPQHLRWATPSENHKDAVAHGTHSGIQNRGDQHRMAKLTSDDVRAIRVRLAAGDKHGQIAQSFGVGRSAISQVAAGTNWAHVA